MNFSTNTREKKDITSYMCLENGTWNFLALSLLCTFIMCFCMLMFYYYILLSTIDWWNFGFWGYGIVIFLFDFVPRHLCWIESLKHCRDSCPQLPFSYTNWDYMLNYFGLSNFLKKLKTQTSLIGAE